MTCTAFLQKWKLLTFFILLTVAHSYVEGSYSVRDDEGCQERSCSTCSRSPACTVNHSSRGGATHRCSAVEAPGRLPRPAAWLLVALLSAIAGGTACWLANLLAPPPGCGRKTCRQRSPRDHQLPADTSGTRNRTGRQAQTDMPGNSQLGAT
ncbi:uncharacterized protein LOC126190845 [Schistocerca cancellata]|uniref:uncharacterized protein LOC126190845 n=1 Tax=Schistocerca cancellata TaxID=274614 RepID=UPI00211915C6|nr:uncharacterized protein LOC126190845 [Schistocerca cancellata]